jgi:hypothetical protein
MRSGCNFVGKIKRHLIHCMTCVFFEKWFWDTDSRGHPYTPSNLYERERERR